MNFFAKIIRKIDRGMQYLENPDLWYLRQNDGIFDLYETVNQPCFKDLNLKTILDIGANVGQSTVTFARVFPEASIYALEPIPECYSRLEERFRENNNVHPVNVALGEEPGELVLELSDYTPSSSLLKMHNKHLESFPNTVVSKTINVRVERLDDFADSMNLKEPILAKIDVQGFEDKVIAGGRETLKKCHTIILETSFETLYEGQPLFHDIYSSMLSLGFRYGGSVGHLLDPINGNILQSDSLFIK